MYMPAGGDDRNWWSKVIGCLPLDAWLEIGIHPGNAERWRREQAQDATRFAELCRNAGADLVTWHDVPTEKPVISSL
jgi:hypothetical protein